MMGFEYNALNRVVRGGAVGAGIETYTYDAVGRVSTIGVSNPIAIETALQRLFYDESGNVMAVYDTGYQEGVEETTFAFAFDYPRGRGMSGTANFNVRP